MRVRKEQRIVRIGIPLYKEVAKRAARYGYTLSDALAKVIESYERKIKRLERENRELEELREFKRGMKLLTDLPCNICGKPMDNNWTDPKVLKLRDQIIELVIKPERWGHTSCHKSEKD